MTDRTASSTHRLASRSEAQGVDLYDNFIPGIKDGTYRLVLQQSVEYTDPDAGRRAHHYVQDRRFVVQGPRFHLPAADIHAVFPPEAGVGDYEHLLPTIVLRKRALPWERTMDGSDVRVPWLALLVLGQQEIEQALRDTVTPADLIVPDHRLQRTGSGITLLPELQDERDGGDRSTKVRVLDLPLTTFRSICPSLHDLRFLAHVRCVDPSDKVPLHMHADGDFAVVVANRFPQPGANLACLVSLEGWHSLLAEDPAGGRQVPYEADRVRLVLLTSWAFVSGEGASTFGDLTEGLDLDLLQAVAAAGAIEDPAVGGALEQGYVPVAYHPRRSTPTIAWYRGPFVPHRAPPLPKEVGLFHRSDAAMIFDPDTGLMDISYASAWELGRLLALENPTVSRDLRAFVNGEHDAFDVAAEVAQFLEMHRSAVKRYLQRERADLMNRLLGAGLSEVETEELLDALQGDSPALTRQRSAELLAGLKAEGLSKRDTALLQAALPQVGAQERRLEVADELLHWLGRLVLLYPVPFAYLVAHGRLLPAESLRFFYVDDNWVEALVDGALSVAFDCSRDHHVLHPTSRNKLHRALSKLVYHYRRHLQGLVDLSDPAEGAPDTYMDEVKSGVLLRSSLVSGWPGLEVQCYGLDGRRLHVVRMDHLAQDLLLCVVEGAIAHIQVIEPPEGLRLGLDDEGAILLRRWKTAPVGSPVDQGRRMTRVLDNHRRAGSATGVLDVSSLAPALAEQIATLESAGPGDPMTASFGPAAFAAQLLLSPQRHLIVWKR